MFLDKKTHEFHFDDGGERRRYVLIFGDEVEPLGDEVPGGPGCSPVRYRGRDGEWEPPPLREDRSLELYFLDVGQGDAAFVVTPNDTKVLVDGGLRERALGFLVWKYRLDDESSPDVVIDHLVLSHADLDHVDGLIPVLEHPKIVVRHVHHNGIARYGSGFDTGIGDRTPDGHLATLHDTLDDLDGCDLASGGRARFAEWIRAVRDSGASYRRHDRSQGRLDVGDPAVTVEIVGPVLEPDGSAQWFGKPSDTLNGHSLVLRLSYGAVRVLFAGDLNHHGSRHLLAQPDAELDLNAHVLKAPHHGSSEFDEELLRAVNPMLTVVSSGEEPDHGHPAPTSWAASGTPVAASGRSSSRPSSPPSSARRERHRTTTTPASRRGCVSRTHSPTPRCGCASRSCCPASSTSGPTASTSTRSAGSSSGTSGRRTVPWHRSTDAPRDAARITEGGG